MELLYKLYKLLNRREKIVGGLVTGLFCITSVLEVFGLGCIFIYVKLILDPTQVKTIPPLLWLQEFIAVDTRHFLVILGGLLLVVLAAKAMMALVCAWANFRYSLARMASFSADLFQIYLSKDYTYFLNHNSSDLKQNILDEIYNVTFNVLIPVLYIISETLALSCIVLLLLFLHPIQTLIMFAITGLLFGGYLLAVKKRLDKLGIQKSMTNQARHRLVGDAFSTIKEVILWNAKENFIHKFRRALQGYSYSMAWSHILLQVPRYLIEAVGFCLIVALMMYQLLHSQNPADIISLIALYGAAGIRMMPSFNRIATNAAQIRFHKRSLYSFYNDLFLRRSMLPLKSNKKKPTEEPLPFERAITYDQVSFAYEKDSRNVVHDISLLIHKRSTIAFVGTSGAGKSTLIDLLLGLIYPDSGTIRIDDVPLDPFNISAWRKQVGYVPQRVVLFDESVAANVAFGIPPAERSMAQVEWACKVAKIDLFIEQSLEHGYQTRLGENGIRLSGGQAQRIAIARALYHKPSVLILDEATAALDGVTEHEIIETMEELAGKMTIIMIAHRLNTVKNCDMIYLFEKGQIVDWGTYPALLERNAHFQKMAG